MVTVTAVYSDGVLRPADPLDKRGPIQHLGELPEDRLAEVERTVLRTLGVRSGS